MFDNNTNKHIGWIYKIYNTNNDKLYIGQTLVSIEHRWIQHKNSSKNPKLWNGVLYKAMRKYGENLFFIECIEEIAADTKYELKKLLNKQEIYYIKKYDSLVPNGYNLTKGGNNVSINKNIKVSAYLLNGDFHKKYNSITDAYDDVKLANTSGGASLICSCCKGDMQYAYGYVWRYDGESFDKYPVEVSQDVADRYHCMIPVDKYSTSGKLLNEYKSVKEACESIKEDGYKSSMISRCCNGDIKTAYGYIWRYHSDPFNKYDINIYEPKRIKQYSLEGVYIKTFNNSEEIIKELDLISASNIYSCCIGNKYSAFGYVWRYEQDNFNTYKIPQDREKCGMKYRKINQYTKDDIYIKTFEKSSEAANEVKCRQTSITNACGRQGGGCNGYKWFYANDPTQPDKTKILIT